MGEQMSLLDLMMPPPAPPKAYVPRPRREVMTRAYGCDTVLKIDAEAPDPVEVEIRGIPCLMVRDYGFCTYALQTPGSMFWSVTGYRSIATSAASIEDGTALVEKYIDAPVKAMGLGGKLVRWWPGHILDWLQKIEWAAKHDHPGTTMWDQWGRERQAEHWASHRAQIAELQARIIAEGYDLNGFSPPPWFKGKWPTFPQEHSA